MDSGADVIEMDFNSKEIGSALKRLAMHIREQPSLLQGSIEGHDPVMDNTSPTEPPGMSLLKRKIAVKREEEVEDDCSEDSSDEENLPVKRKISVKREEEVEDDCSEDSSDEENLPVKKKSKASTEKGKTKASTENEGTTKSTESGKARASIDSDGMPKLSVNAADLESIETKLQEEKNPEDILEANFPLRQSKFKGVSWDRHMRSWRVKLNSVHLGYFDDENDAARAYDEANISCRGKIRDSDLNFPGADYQEAFKSGKIGTTYLSFQSRREGTTRGTSRYRGVMFDKVARKFRAKIRNKQKTVYLGLFKDEIQAGRAYDRAALGLKTDRAILNFPSDFACLPEIEPRHYSQTALKAIQEQAVEICRRTKWTEKEDGRIFAQLQNDMHLVGASRLGETMAPRPRTSLFETLKVLSDELKLNMTQVGARATMISIMPVFQDSFVKYVNLMAEERRADWHPINRVSARLAGLEGMNNVQGVTSRRRSNAEATRDSLFYGTVTSERRGAMRDAYNIMLNVLICGPDATPSTTERQELALSLKKIMREEVQKAVRDALKAQLGDIVSEVTKIVTQRLALQDQP